MLNQTESKSPFVDYKKIINPVDSHQALIDTMADKCEPEFLKMFVNCYSEEQIKEALECALLKLFLVSNLTDEEAIQELYENHEPEFLEMLGSGYTVAQIKRILEAVAFKTSTSKVSQYAGEVMDTIKERQGL
jgi:hypothetical protein